MNENRRFLTLQRILGAVKQRGEGGVLLSAVLLAALASALAAPRPTEPVTVPLPAPNRGHLHELERVDHERAEDARRHPLSFATRSVGEMIRRTGEAAGTPNGNTQAALGDLRRLTLGALREEGTRGLLALRAVQSELFVSAARAWAASGALGSELRELGGDFPELATRSGWREGDTLVLTDEELALLFRLRWNDLTGLSGNAPFALSLDELRDRYALLLRHPAGEDLPTRLKHQLGYVAALEKLDHDYPAAFARGVLDYRSGAYEASAAAFRAHLTTHPNGPWSLRARNHLLAALAQTADRD